MIDSWAATRTTRSQIKKHHHLLIAHHILLNMLCETLFAPQIAAIDHKWKSNVKEKASEKVSVVKTLNLVLRREKHLFELVKTYNHRLCYPVYLMALWLFNICMKERGATFSCRMAKSACFTTVEFLRNKLWNGESI